MRVVFMGTPHFAVPSLNVLFEHGADIQAVVTQPDRPHGRGNKVLFSPVKEAALEMGLPILQPARAREIVDRLREVDTDFYVVVAFGQILPKSILDIPIYGCVNVHASLLPKYRGAAPIPHAILNGETVTGVTIMAIDEGMDTGPELLKQEASIEETDTAGSLSYKLSRLGAQCLMTVLVGMRHQAVTPRPQDHERATYAPKISKEDGRIDWSRPAAEICRRVRAFDPWPGSFTTLGGKTLKIWRAREVGAGEADAEPGTVIVAGLQGGIVVAAGEGAVAAEDVQLEGKNRLTAEEFLRGHPLKVGTALGG